MRTIDVVVRACHVTGKRAYASRVGARLAVESLRSREERSDFRLSVYSCRWCGFYHLGNDLKPIRRKPLPTSNRPRSSVRRELKMSSATIISSEATIGCPSCGGQNIRVNLMGEAIHLVAVDPVSGEVKHGKQVDFLEKEPVPIYFCADCQYENVVPSMFVKREGV